MSQLQSHVKQAVLDAARRGLPGGAMNGSWASLSEAIRARLYTEVAERLLEVDNGTVSTALLEALEDGRLDKEEIKGALLGAAAGLTGNSEAAAVLREALANGPLDRDAAIRVIVAWGRSRIEDETLRSLFIGLAEFAGSGSDRPRAQEILDRVLRASGLDAALVGRALGAMNDGRIDSADLLLLLTTWAAAAGRRDLAGLGGNGNLLARAEAVLQAGFPEGAETLLRNLLEEDWPGVLSALLGTLDLGMGGSLLRQLAGGRFRELAVRKLTGLLENAGLEQAGTVANAIVDIATGARRLFAEGEDSDSGLQRPADLALWREIRKVLYTARLATFGGTIVPTGAQAQPHIFAAAAIRFNTPLQKLLPTDADDSVKQRFCERVTEFLDERFGSRMRRRFRDEPVLAITVTDLRPNGSTGEVIFFKVERRLA